MEGGGAGGQVGDGLVGVLCGVEVTAVLVLVVSNREVSRPGKVGKSVSRCNLSIAQDRSLSTFMQTLTPQCQLDAVIAERQLTFCLDYQPGQLELHSSSKQF